MSNRNHASTPMKRISELSQNVSVLKPTNKPDHENASDNADLYQSIIEWKLADFYRSAKNWSTLLFSFVCQLLLRPVFVSQIQNCLFFSRFSFVCCCQLFWLPIMFFLFKGAKAACDIGVTLLLPLLKLQPRPGKKVFLLLCLCPRLTTQCYNGNTSFYANRFFSGICILFDRLFPI